MNETKQVKNYQVINPNISQVKLYMSYWSIFFDESDSRKATSVTPLTIIVS